MGDRFDTCSEIGDSLIHMAILDNPARNMLLKKLSVSFMVHYNISYNII